MFCRETALSRDSESACIRVLNQQTRRGASSSDSVAWTSFIFRERTARLFCMTQHHAARLRCEYLENPIGIDELHPRFSWWMIDLSPAAKQTAYRIRVATSIGTLSTDKPDLWDSGKVESSDQVGIVYAGKPLTSRTQAVWDVTIWDANGNPSDPSQPARFEMGLLEKSDWTAQWIETPIEGTGVAAPPVPILRRTFSINKPIQSARLYTTALGVYDAHINGQRVSDDYFRPGWTDYHKRIQYQTYDVAKQVAVGENTIATLLGDGWYVGRVAFNERGVLYGTRPALCQQLEITHTDGSITQIVTDETWRYLESPIRSSDMLDGESYDARMELSDWNAAGFSGESHPVLIAKAPDAPLVAQMNESVRIVKELTPVNDPKPATGTWNSNATIFDFGQNFSGIVRLQVKGPRGATIRLRYAEMLKENGGLYTENLRAARVTDHYTLKGDPNGETWQPRFTFHGFRYVELSFSNHWKDQKLAQPMQPFDKQSVCGLVLMSDTRVTGEFECSHPLLNQLQSNIQWGQRGNFLEVPTDCPQRDERLGWTGDAQVFASTAAYNMDVAGFFTKWMRDCDDAEQPDGRVPRVVPEAGIGPDDAGPGWSDARVICPWTMYQAYADHRMLERHYEPMKRWIDWQARSLNEAGIRCSENCGYFTGYSDWLALDSTWQSVWSATPKDFIGTAYFAHSAGIMADIAKVLGRAADAKLFANYRQKAVEGFNREFVTASGRLSVQTQAAYLFALGFDLLPENLRQPAFDRLLKLFEERHWHLSTGFLGTPMICPVLTRFGRADIAYKILLQEDYPGWLFPVKNGATTMWERWNSWTPDKGFGDAGMNSFNHYAYGAIGRWMYDNIAGIAIDPAQPGYSHIRLTPTPGGGLTHARAAIDTVRGRVEASWKIENAQFNYTVTLPPNTTATLFLPDGKSHQLQAGKHAYECVVRDS